MVDIEKMQQLLRQYGYDGWLFVDFQGHDFITGQILELHGRSCTRRMYYYIPASGMPVKILSSIEPLLLDHLPGKKYLYKGKAEQDLLLKEILLPGKQIVCQYSPEGNVPVISSMDAGTAEYLRSFGVTLISSADLLQYFGAVLSKKQVESHKEAGIIIHRILDESFRWIRRSLQDGRHPNEWTYLQCLRQLIELENMYMDGDPFLGVDEHTADPGYEPTPETALPIREGSRLIIDIAGRLPEEDAVFYDVSWCMNVGDVIDPVYQNLFDAVYAVRRKTTEFIQSQLDSGLTVRGCDADAFAMDIIRQMRMEKYVMHRTGHNIGHNCHGIGANLDDYETHDTRTLLPGTMFSVEPGIYMPGYGVRLEYDVYITREKKLTVFGPVQDKIRII